VLIGIYGREKKPDRALQLLDALADKYPQNYLIGVERARMLFLTGSRDQANRAFGAMLEQPRASAEATDLVCYQWGEALLGAGDFAGAVSRYKQVIDWRPSEAGLVSLAHLHSGQALDLAGQREQALAEYRIVLARENIFDSHDLARQYTKAPYNGKEDR